METARELWSDIADDMIDALEYTAAHPTEVSADTDSMLHTYAMYLCAEKRDTRAFAPILRMISHPDPWVLEGLFGDVLTQAGGRIIASSYAGDIRPIQQLIENREAYEFSRSQGLIALTTLVANGQLEREALTAYLRELLDRRLERAPSHVWTAVVYSAADLAARELLPQIEKVYEEELIEGFPDPPESIFSTLTEGGDFAVEKLAANPDYTLIEDTVAEMEWWAAFRDANDDVFARRGVRSLLEANSQRAPVVDPEEAERIGGTVRREQPKVGRNDPCPCGSGLKF
ncbi:MAG: DUF1186 domain-containing protein, partial [bacterium]